MHTSSLVLSLSKFTRLGRSSALSLGLVAASAVAADAPADAPRTEPRTLAKTVVTDVAEPNDVFNAELATAALSTVPGAVRLITSEQLDKGRAGTTADILAFQPGVYAQETAGGDGIKLSVRGSAINRGAGNSYRSGIFIAFDGLPVTVPGGAPYELQEPFSFLSTEVLLGANGFEYGPRNFGGAINFITPTGYDSALFGVRVEAGSFGYYKAQVSSGAVLGKFDYHVNLTGTRREGFQRQSELETLRAAFNLGFQLNPNVGNRFFFRFGYTNHDSPGALTKWQIEHDPRAANPTNIATNSRRIHPRTLWVGDKLTIRPDADSSLELGLLYHDYPIEIYGAQTSFYHYGTLSAQAKYRRADLIGGRPSNTTFAVISSSNLYGWYDRWPNRFGTGARNQKNDFSGSADNVVLALNDLELRDAFWITTGASVVQTRRKNVFTVSNPVTYEQDDYDFAPRAGLRYNFTPDVQVYTNVSRTIEPRNDWAGSTGAFPNFTQIDLKNQTATTGEIGTRAKRGIFSGTLSYYRASIENALLSVETFPGSGVSVESNASPTRHQGVELGLDTELWRGAGASPGARVSTLSLRQSYTWSDFKYKHDPRFGRNRLPGVPEHYYQADLFFEHATGFHASLNVRSASSLFVDYANTSTADAFTVYGAKVGYEPAGGKWQVYVDLRNLTDEHYAASVSPTFNDNFANGPRYSPGDLFSVYGGFAYRF